MNRTDRLHTLLGELRAAAPEALPAGELATRLGVSVRTVERDVSDLRRAGIPVRAAADGHGGYLLAEGTTLGPLDLTPAEAAAVVAALTPLGEGPARDALRKLHAALPASVSTQELAVRPGPAAEAEPYPRVSAVVERALLHGRVLRIEYEDRRGHVSVREVEPTVLVGGRGGHWYLVGVCGLRQDARAFRLDRVRRAEETGETASEHPADPLWGISPGARPGPRG
ncbi:helix-turn-helix transcriptional regulator [Streptosporangium saharense]|uniref:helix-turn-helix transcriptional regulator n=1 Tax=Streptosporangium saharense TaxID=1706840 RepID=UPI0036B52829